MQAFPDKSETRLTEDISVRNHVVDNYENYREEDRLTTNHARKIEFITTARILD